MSEPKHDSSEAEDRSAPFYERAGLLSTSLRWVLGWLFFSAAWRRLVLAPDKLDLEAPGNLGVKLTHFLPHAIDPGGAMEWTLRHPSFLLVLLYVVTIAEGLAGLGLLLGAFSRLSGAAVALLSGVILFSAGWLGTTCLDEWQIGVLGIVGGATIALLGPGPLSLDRHLARSGRLGRWAALGAGPLPRAIERRIVPVALGLAAAALLLTLGTNQLFHGGLWGTLHNLSATPHAVVEEASIDEHRTHFSVMRDEGPDTYGAFVIGAELLDEGGAVVARMSGEELAQTPADAIHNLYLAKVHPGPNGLVLPLGARAEVELPLTHPEATRLRLLEVGGRRWEAPLRNDRAEPDPPIAHCESPVSCPLPPG